MAKKKAAIRRPLSQRVAETITGARRTLAGEKPAQPVRRVPPPRATAPQQPERRAPRAPRRRVTATAMGFYDHKRRRIGDVFDLKQPGDFSAKWMQDVAASTPTKETGPSAALKQAHDEILGGRVEGRSEVTGGMEVQGNDNAEGQPDGGTDNPLGD